MKSRALWARGKERKRGRATNPRDRKNSSSRDWNYAGTMTPTEKGNDTCVLNTRTPLPEGRTKGMEKPTRKTSRPAAVEMALNPRRRAQSIDVSESALEPGLREVQTYEMQR